MNMSYGLFSKSVVRGIAAVLPKNRLNMESLKEVYGEKEVDNIIKITGIKELRIAPLGTTASDYCAEAAKILFANTDLSPQMVDGIVFVSQSPDYPVPHTAAILQYRLGLPVSTFATDMVLGCTGYAYGLFTGMMLIETGYCKNVLLCAGDTMHRRVHPDDKVLRMEIGDAGTATWISAEQTSSSSVFAFFTDGANADALIIPEGGSRRPGLYKGADVNEIKAPKNGRHECCTEKPQNLYMDGMRLMRFALQEVPPVINDLLEAAGWGTEEVDLFAFHQSSEPVLKYLARKLEIEQAKIPIGLTLRGNTGAASIPVMLCDFYSGQNKYPLTKTITCGFGAGLAIATGSMDLSQAVICPTSEL